MASKLLVATLRPWATVTMLTGPRKNVNFQKITCLPVMAKRQAGELIPRTQYDTPWPKKMRIGTVLTKNWETIPLFFVTMSAVTILILSIIWACEHKVDVVYDPNKRNKNQRNISRSMNLHDPTYHKWIIIDQYYEPWPEMANLVRKLNIEDIKQKRKDRAYISKMSKKFSDEEVFRFEASTRKK